MSFNEIVIGNFVIKCSKQKMLKKSSNQNFIK